MSDSTSSSITRRAELADRIRDAWRHGRRLMLEELLADQPTMPRQGAAFLELLCEEYLARRAAGESPSVEEYAARFPDDVGSLTRLFELYRELGDSLTAADAARRVCPSAATVTMSFAPSNGSDTPAPLRTRPPAAGTKLKYLGNYELVEEIARGGMGVVFKARQARLNRVVAVKMILAGQLADEAEVRRFQSEATAAAQLDHPHIVPVYEVGEHEGLHYFSMGYVEGRPLSKRLADGPLPPHEAAELVRTAALAVQYAHEHGVIHRDLKPGNILIDSAGQPRITDFGLAKSTRADSGLTGTGQILGTPSYMPPEQAAGRTDETREPADVYALGAVLYATLTGRPPFQADNALDTLRLVVEREPIAPRQLNPALPLDLDTICLKCLEKSPGKRYSTARELAEELDRFLEGKPISARPVGPVERAWRWCRRNPAVASLLTAVAASLVAGAAISTYFAVEASRRADDNLKLAGRNRDLAEQETAARQRADDAREAAEQSRIAAEKSAAIAQEQTRIAQLESANLNLNEALAHCEKEEPHIGVLRMAAAHERATAAGDLDLADACRAMASLWLPQTPRLRKVYAPSRHSAVAFYGPDDKLVYVVGKGPDADKDAALREGFRIYDAQTEKLIDQTPGLRSPTVWPAVNAERTRILLLDAEDRPRIWSIPDKAWVGEPLAPAGAIDQAEFSGDGWRLITATRDGTFECWNVNDGKPTGVSFRHPGLNAKAANPRFCFNGPAGAYLYVGGAGADIRAFDPNSGGEPAAPLTGVKGHVGLLRSAPAGGQFAATRLNPNRIMLHWMNGTSAASAEAPSQRVLDMSISPDGRWLAEGGEANQLVIRDTATAGPAAGPALVRGKVTGVRFSHAGHEVLLANYFGDVEAWELPLRLTRRNRRVNVHADAARFNTGYNTVMIVGSNGYQRYRNPEAGEPIDTYPSLPDQTLFADIEPTGRYLIGATKAGHAFRMDIATREVRLSTERHATPITRYVMSPRGDCFATQSASEVRLWRVSDAAQLGKPVEFAAITVFLRFTADGSLFAISGYGTNGRALPLRIVQVADGGEARPPVTVPESSLVELHPDGRRLLVVTWTRLELWDLDPLAKRKLLGTHDHNIRRIEFSADGRLALSHGDDQVVRVWDLERNARVGRPIRGVPTKGATVILRPDGQWIGTLVPGEIVKHWHVASGRLLGSPSLGLQGGMTWKGFDQYGYSKDSREFVFYDPESTYPFVDVPPDSEAFRLFVELWTGLTLEDNDVRVLRRNDWKARREWLAEMLPELVDPDHRPNIARQDIMRAARATRPVTVDGDLGEWSKSEEYLACEDLDKVDITSIRLRTMWDEDALYIGIAWRDATPLVNNIDADSRSGEGWMADCFQGRITIDNQEYHLTAWHSSISNKSVAVIEHGTPMLPDKRMVFVGAGLNLREQNGFEQAFRRADDGLGYTQELRVPWKLLDDSLRPQDGQRLRFTGEFIWGDATAKTWSEDRWSTPINPRLPRRTDVYAHPQSWGELELIDAATAP